MIAVDIARWAPGRLRIRPVSVWLCAAGVGALAAVVPFLLFTSAPTAGHSLQTGVDSGWAAVPMPVRGTISSAIGRDIPSDQVRRTAAGLVARNSEQRLQMSFARGGVRLESGGATLGLRFDGIGRGAQLAPVVPVVPTAKANAVSYGYRSVRESFANGPLGLEQGFTVERRPAGMGPLTIALRLSGSLAARAREDQGDVVFGSLAYRGLVASDARGRVLPARLELRGDRVLIRVADAGAEYPLRVDPFVQLAELRASDGTGPNHLGESIAIDGDTIVACATGAHAAYVFVEPNSGWANATETAKLTPSVAGGDFGESVGISGGTIVVGDEEATVGSNQPGAVYVFVEANSGWASAHETAELTASDGADGDNLGQSVAVSGDTVVAGAPDARIGSNSNQGAAYVFVKPGGGWVSGTETAKLTASDGADGDNLGQSVAVSGDTVVAGAPNARIGSNSNQGAAYVFVKPGGGWVSGTETAKLTASDGADGDNLGQSVAVSGDTAVAGAPAAANGGAAYVFIKPGGGWATEHETAKLTASDGGGSLGRSVAIDGATVAAGAPSTAVSHSSQGAVYFFVEPYGGWATETQTAKLVASDGNLLDGLGQSVGASDGTIAAGAPYLSSEPVTGLAYAFSGASVPGAPTVVSAAGGNAQATVSFSAPSSNGGAAIGSYTVTASPGGATASGSASPLTVTGLSNATSYTFTVTATNVIGTGSASAASNTVIAGAPGAPANVIATAGDSQAVVSFAAPSGNGLAITSYTVTASPGATTATAAASPITVSGLSDGTTYTFIVTATNADGTGPASAASNAVTPAAATTQPATTTTNVAPPPNTQPPTAPSGLTGSFSAGELVLSWQASSDSTGVDHYELYLNGVPIERVPAQTTSIDVRIFDPSGKGVYAVRAFDAAGNESGVLADVTVEPVKRPKGVPKRVPQWAWTLLAWQQHHKGTKPTAPKPLPPWYATWKAWRLQPFKLAS